VLLLDADLRTSTLGERYGADTGVGLSSVLAGGRHWSDAVHHCAGLPMSILPAGAPLADPAAQLGSPAMADLLEQLTGRFGLVLVNCPPVLGSAEALVLSHLADGTLVVTGRKSKRTRPLTEAVEALRLAGARLVGVVLAT
jgi:Mrp family chromosome partitioning ATPase